MMRGYDVDGVLVPRKVDPVEPYIVVTGRTADEFERTLADVGTGAAVYCRPFGAPGDRQAAGEWKATVIALSGVVEFFEDDPLQAEIVRSRCPGCRVELVR